MRSSLSLYIHLPWCIKKCPYCDFNSHVAAGAIPETAYIDCLLADFTTHLPRLVGREISTIFFGGGTPSLFSAESITYLLDQLRHRIDFSPTAEISLEANPGTVEQTRFSGYFAGGINRISLGIQSFQAEKLRALGRIHNDVEAHAAISAVKNAGFKNFNIDLMHGLPQQSTAEALQDLATAMHYEPTHLSWYQLTLEPNTYFYQHPPPLPQEAVLWRIEQAGLALLKKNQYRRYEISAYAKPGAQARHNKNYWLFGDYLGIGAGAHSKLTQNNKIIRHWNHKSPFAYMKKSGSFISNHQALAASDIVFEFMLNALRLLQPISFAKFEKITGLPRNILEQPMRIAIKNGLLKDVPAIATTALGRRFLNDLCHLFLKNPIVNK